MATAPIPVLLVEDDRHVQRSLSFQLQKLGYAVTCREDGETGLAEAIRGEYGVVILDLMLPRLDGFRVCASLRAARPELPIVITSARVGEEDKVRGLDLGADDYLAKPFSLAELAARLRAVRRRTPPEDAATPIERGPLRLDRRRGELFAAGQPVRLSRREYQMIELLMAHPGRLFSREALLRRVWGDGNPNSARVVDQHLYTLRRRLREFLPQEFIEVVREMGVRFVDRLDEDAVPGPAPGPRR
ncbi:MAG: response regulator transcription factor [Terriglobales bacterium]